MTQELISAELNAMWQQPSTSAAAATMWQQPSTSAAQLVNTMTPPQTGSGNKFVRLVDSATKYNNRFKLESSVYNFKFSENDSRNFETYILIIVLITL